ncbi:NUDIX domain-containing protein [Jatrophihabitans sp. YIM 134969]
MDVVTQIPRAPTPGDLADRVLAAPPRLGTVRVVAVDGGAAAGKSTLARALAAAVRDRGHTAEVLQTDFLLEGWDGQFTFHDRLRDDVLAPLAAGRPGRVARYDWHAGRFDGETEVRVADVVVVEGVSAVAACGDAAALTVWVDLDRPERERRWLARDREDHLLPEWRRWLDREDAWFAAHPVSADVVVGGGEVPGGEVGGVIRTVAQRAVHTTPWMTVREDEVQFPDGSRGTFGVVAKRDFVTVVAAERDGFWLVEQFRYPVGSRQWEFPQGGWPAGHSGTQADLARAELAEETGLRAATWEHLGRLFAAYGYSDQSFDVFLATDLTLGPTRREASEQDMVTRWFPEAEVRRMVRHGRFADSNSVAALLLLDDHRARTDDARG